MPYQALYRTYRPKRFSEVVGQDHVVRTLINSVKQDKVGHAYLFSGPRGTGKTTVARILAKVINCEKPKDGEPCGECSRCKGTEEGLGVIEIDAASHGSVDDMRQLVAQVSQVPLSGGMMVYIIDEVHMLSKEAFNAFLKTLEEPPSHAVFVLATTEPGKLLPTIHSRCQRFAFRRVPIDLVAEHIAMICTKEKVPAEDTALRLIARAGEGSVRDSISVLEQAIAYEPKGLTLEGVRNVLGIPDRIDIRNLAGAVIADNPGEITSLFAGLIESGRETGAILEELLAHFRDLLLAGLDLEHSELDLLPAEEREIVEKQAQKLDVERIHRAISSLAECEGQIKWEDEAALLLEVSLLSLARALARPAREPVVMPAVEHEKAGETEQMFPQTRPKIPLDVPKDKAKSATPDRPSLTGGASLKKTKAATLPPPAPSAPKEKVAAEDKKAEKIPAKKSGKTIRIPEDLDPFWKNAMESVREASIAEYVLLAEATPSPPPSEWPDAGDDSSEPLDLTLRYPYDCGLVVRMINEPMILDRLTRRLAEVLERPVSLKLARERGEKSSEDSGGPRQLGMYDGEGPVAGTQPADRPSLFPGAGPEPPADPELRRIHDLIANDFPDYKIEQGGSA